MKNRRRNLEYRVKAKTEIVEEMCPGCGPVSDNFETPE